MSSPTLDAHFKRLKERYPDAVLTPLPSGAGLITLSNRPLLAAWSPATVALHFIAPVGYSVAAPDSFWLEPNVMVNGVVPKNSATNHPIPETGITGHYFSWHLEANRWSPNNHDLLTFVSVCLKRLECLE
ncbi:hypothetical protein JQ616_35375 [Bradyrhizobium tropiciagri]|uniref:E2/UBC family protein n=1 Tax=Bradyrhizobium tropiciagri TaxID=312253 RepID=UPI001BA97D1E|nr:E2/UBC family protein [Bradyrhizobium tropiciagri]MBR0900261.1 hypothetical protein [Bradyrhizobium tropiciagri]